MCPQTQNNGALLITNVKPVAFGQHSHQGAIDILVGEDGKVAQVGKDLPRADITNLIEGNGSFISPGWADLHAHVWHGGTDISVRPNLCGT